MKTLVDFRNGAFLFVFCVVFANAFLDSSGSPSYAPWPEPDEFVQVFAALTPWQVQAAQKIRDWSPLRALHG